MTDLDKLKHINNVKNRRCYQGSDGHYVVGYKTAEERTFALESLKLLERMLDEAHLAAQRQGGVCSACDGKGKIRDVDNLGSSIEICGYCHGVGRTALAHPPAVTGDRGAALAFIETWRHELELMNDTAEGNPLETIRAALLSAQGGVPGDVVEKAAKTINSLRNRLIQHNYRGDDRDDDILFEAQSTLTLLTPYLNNGRGG